MSRYRSVWIAWYCMFPKVPEERCFFGKVLAISIPLASGVRLVPRYHIIPHLAALLCLRSMNVYIDVVYSMNRTR